MNKTLSQKVYWYYTMNACVILYLFMSSSIITLEPKTCFRDFLYT